MSSHDDDGSAAATRPECCIDYLSYADIRDLIDRHLDGSSLMIDVHTRFLLSRLGDSGGHAARSGSEWPVEEG